VVLLFVLVKFTEGACLIVITTTTRPEAPSAIRAIFGDLRP
jgi:hypothetical protein